MPQLLMISAFQMEIYDKEIEAYFPEVGSGNPVGQPRLDATPPGASSINDSCQPQLSQGVSGGR